MGFLEKDTYQLEDLLEIISILRSPSGCPWDQKQTHHSIRRNFIEETYEACEAIDNEDPVLLKEELGDVLLQIVLHAEMEREIGTFDFADICDGLCKKLVFRHPHVFGEAKAANSEDALGLWEQSKQTEKGQTTVTQTLEQVSKALPALLYSEKVQKRAAKVGFDYPNTGEALLHLKCELAELEEAMEQQSPDHIHEELGDLLFSTVNVSRFLFMDPEQALNDSSAKFIGRFALMERLATERGMDLGEADFNLLNSLWEEAKDIH